MAEVQRQAEHARQHEAQSDEQARDMAHVLNRTVLTIKARAGMEDKLYGSVTSTDISDAIWKARKIRIDRRKVELDEPIKTLGSHRVTMTVWGDVRAVIKVMVVPGGSRRRGRRRGLRGRARRSRATRRRRAARWQSVSSRTKPHLPPQDLDAEESVLGAMLVSGNAVATVSELLQPEDFYRRSHATIYAHDPGDVRRGRERRLDHAHNALSNRGLLDEVGRQGGRPHAGRDRAGGRQRPPLRRRSSATPPPTAA